VYGFDKHYDYKHYRHTERETGKVQCFDCKKLCIQENIHLTSNKADVFLELPKCSSKMAELIKTKINRKSPKFHECSPQRCIFKDESSKDVALQCRKCHRAVHYQCSQLPAYQIQLCLSFKERCYQCPNCIKVSQQVLEELGLSRRDTIEINDNTKKKVNNTNNNIENNNGNTKNENKHNNKHNNRNPVNNNNNKQSNELNINGEIEERLMKLESKFKYLVETSEKKKEALQKPSYANIAAIDINKTRDSGIELEVAKSETEETETKRRSHDIL